MQIIPNLCDYVLIVAEIYFPLNSTPLQSPTEGSNAFFTSLLSLRLFLSVITRTMVRKSGSDSELMSSKKEISTFLSIIIH